MDGTMILLRLLHVVLGAYWAGTIIFTALYLDPSVRAVGPPGGQVMAQMIKRGHLTVMPVVALVTILTGVELLRRMSGGFDPGWMRSDHGMTLSVGALAAIAAFLIGVFVMRSASLRVMALMQQAMQTPEGPDRDKLIATAAPLRARVTASLRVVATLLGVAIAAMAVAQYM